MRQSITTKYHGPTNSHGARISATSSGGHRIYVHWDHSLDVEANHIAACDELAHKLEWFGNWIGGESLGRAGYTFVIYSGVPDLIVRKVTEKGAKRGK